MSENLAAFFYLIASVCFILALRGLSSPRTARIGNLYGIAGMVIAVVTTLLTPHVVSYGLIIAGIVIGGAVGTYIAVKIQMTALPQLVAAFHSLVGLAAVCVAAAAFTAPQDFGIGVPGAIERASLVEMSIGMAIGAITFTGSIVAFSKLQGLVSGAAIDVSRPALPERRPRRVAGRADRHRCRNRGIGGVLAAAAIVAGAGFSVDRADRRRRHAGRDLDAELVFRVGGVRHRLHACRTAS